MRESHTSTQQETNASSDAAFTIAGKALMVTKGLARICRLRDEYYEFVEEPHSYVMALKHKKDLPSDIFTFIQPVYETEPQFAFHLEWDSAAVLFLSSYEHWWKTQINDKTRNMVRRAHKAGVEVRLVEFSTPLALGIQRIYNECPVRQGRPFKHYNKSIEVICREHATFLDRSDFLGAYHKDTMIGFAKITHGKNISNLMNIISLMSERDKAPTNALIAKAVEVCTSKRVPRLQYGTGNSGSIGDFKKHNAFQEVRVARFFVPLNVRGALLLRLGLHRPLQQRIPKTLHNWLLHCRRKWNTQQSSKICQPGAVAQSAERRAKA